MATPIPVLGMATTLVPTGEPLGAEDYPAISESLGPYMVPFLTSCYEANAPRFLFMWVSSLLAMIIGVSIAMYHKHEMSKRPPSMQRMYYDIIAWFAPVLGIAAAVSLFCPRTYLMMKMFQEFTEAMALNAFGNVLFLLCGSEAHEQAFEGDTVAQKMVAGLNVDGPKPHFAVPPFGCCFVKCCPSTPLKPWHMLLARNFIRQYACIVIGGSLTCMWCALALTPDKRHIVKHWVGILTKLSAFVCIYGLFILYKASHNLLHHWSPTAKFISLKVVVVLMAYQDLMIKLAIKHLSSAGTHCLAVEGVTGDMATELQDANRERFNAMYLVALESILVAFLVRRAFPASELKKQDQEIHGMLIQMDLEKMEDNQRGIMYSSESANSDNDTTEG